MKIYLDASKMTTKEVSHQYLKEALSLPDYYGKNLDALHDCLEEMTDVEIIVANTQDAGGYYWRVARVLKDVFNNLSTSVVEN